jgi:hypothetical protein
MSSSTRELNVKRIYGAAWSIAGWAYVLGLKNWYLALGRSSSLC